MNEWRANEIRKIISEFHPVDIYNADETGIFYQLLPDRTFTFERDTCKGGKKSNLRLTALLCCNASGTDKRKPLVFARSVRPTCFKSVKSSSCIYPGNKRAWMTQFIFVNWLLDFDKQMKLGGRHVLLLIDNCSAHSRTPHLTNVRVEFFLTQLHGCASALGFGNNQSPESSLQKGTSKALPLTY